MTTAPAVGIDPLFQIGFQGYGTRGEKNTLNRQFFKERLEVFNAYRLAFLNRSALKLFSITLPIVLIFAENDNPFVRKAFFLHMRRGGPDGPIPHKYTGVSWRRSPGFPVKWSKLNFIGGACATGMHRMQKRVAGSDGIFKPAPDRWGASTNHIGNRHRLQQGPAPVRTQI